MSERGPEIQSSAQLSYSPSDDVIEAAVDTLPEERRDELFAVLMSIEHHSGPLPSPKTLAGYEIVHPGLAAQIVEMAISQQKHDHAFENTALQSESRYRASALVMAAAVVLSTIAGAALCASMKQPIPATALATVSGATLLAGAFIKGRELFPKSEPPKPEPKPQATSNRSQRRRKIKPAKPTS